jgi:sigma-B regulation protein RsbU (phosphoserine phosphatase)
VHTLNRQLLDTWSGETFVTLAAALIDPRTGALEAVGCGHPAPMVVTPNGTIRELRLAEGMPIGLLDIELELSTDRLRPGELLLLYSDGLSECFNEEDEILGVDGLTEMVADIRRAAGRKPDLEWFEAQLKDRLAHHRGRAPASDDISFALALFGA